MSYSDRHLAQRVAASGGRRASARPGGADWDSSVRTASTANTGAPRPRPAAQNRETVDGSQSRRPTGKDSPRRYDPAVHRLNSNHLCWPPEADAPDSATIDSNSDGPGALAPAPAADTQAQLYAQLQDVVLRVSQTALDHKRGEAQTQARLDAFLVLVSEQDALVEQLRRENASLAREKDALLQFRRQGLLYESHRLRERPGREGGAAPGHAEERKLDDWLRQEYSRVGGGDSGPSRRGQAHLFDSLSPSVRALARSLAAQLHDERARRLNIEEQSSRMMGEQQLALARLESQLQARPLATAAGSPPRAMPLRQQQPSTPCTTSLQQTDRAGLSPGSPAHDDAEAILADIRTRYNL